MITVVYCNSNDAMIFSNMSAMHICRLELCQSAMTGLEWSTPCIPGGDFAEPVLDGLCPYLRGYLKDESIRTTRALRR